MGALKYVPGYKVNSFTILERIDSSHVIVKCDCGKVYQVSVSNLSKAKMCMSCGIRKITKIGRYNRKIYHAWNHMVQRCHNKANHEYKHYGGRGIQVCDEWRNDSEAFVKWALVSGWKEGLSIDRIDNNGNYSPENCRWTDCRTQNNNKRNTVIITAFGKTLPCSEWSRTYGIPGNTIRGRIVMGWKPEDAVTKPINTKHRSKKWQVKHESRNKAASTGAY